MLRLLAVFAVLFLGGAAALALLPNPPQGLKPHSAVAESAHLPVDAAIPRPDVRVVYPAPATSIAADRAPGTMAAVASQSDVPASNAAPIATNTPVVSFPNEAQNAGVTPATEAVTPSDDATRVASEYLDLNTASIEALNQLPGAGRIGRTIASHRPYRSVEELLTRRVVRKSVYDRIKDRLAAQ